nr:hypothetical protein [Burkholderia sp. AU15512]
MYSWNALSWPSLSLKFWIAPPHAAVVRVPAILPPPNVVPVAPVPGAQSDSDPPPFAACAIASIDIAPPPTPAITATAAVTDDFIVEFAFDFVRIRAVSGAAAHVPVVAFQTVR